MSDPKIDVIDMSAESPMSRPAKRPRAVQRFQEPSSADVIDLALAHGAPADDEVDDVVITKLAGPHPGSHMAASVDPLKVEPPVSQNTSRWADPRGTSFMPPSARFRHNPQLRTFVAMPFPSSRGPEPGRLSVRVESSEQGQKSTTEPEQLSSRLFARRLMGPPPPRPPPPPTMVASESDDEVQFAPFAPERLQRSVEADVPAQVRTHGFGLHNRLRFRIPYRQHEPMGSQPTEPNTRLNSTSAPASRDAPSPDVSVIEDEMLAIRLQAEEDERVARETASRLAQEEEDRRYRARLDALEVLEQAMDQPGVAMEDEDVAMLHMAPWRQRRSDRSAASREAARNVAAVSQRLQAPEAYRSERERERRDRDADLQRAMEHAERRSREMRDLAQERSDRWQRREAALSGSRDLSSREAFERAELEEMFGLPPFLPVMMPPFMFGSRERSRGGFNSTMRELVMGASRSGLPAHLLFTDRDFTADDYEWLCKLDENVENRKGATTEEIAALPTQSVDATVLKGLATELHRCPVCLEDIAVGATLKSLPCCHKFHSHCIDEWLQQKACCPICQRSCKQD